MLLIIIILTKLTKKKHTSIHLNVNSIDLIFVKKKEGTKK